MNKPPKHFYDFSGFRLDAVNRLLLRDGKPVPLTLKAFDTLLVLVQNAGQVLEKDELMKVVWPDTVVEENNLTQNISALRKAIGEDPNGHKYIETLPRRGYRFVGSVRETWDEGADLVLEKQTSARVIIEEQKEEREEESRHNDLLSGSAKTPLYHSLRLKILAVSMLVLGLAALSYFWMWRAQALKTIAVLPFKPLVADAGDEYLELGMADALITKLSNIKQIIVRPTNSVLKYAAAEQEPLTAGRALEVESVLDGSVQKIGDRIRVTVRLMRVSDGASLWADTFDESFTNIFSVQDSISERIARALELRLTGEEKKLIVKRHTENAKAYQAYLKGRFYWSKWTPATLKKAIEHFEQALKEDSSFALAYSGLADSYHLLGYLGAAPPKEVYPKGEEAALKALAIDESLSEAHLSLAKKKLFYDWDLPGAEREIKQALDLNSNSADIHGTYGTYLLALGRFDEALRERKRAEELDPITPLPIVGVGWVYYYLRDSDRAIEQYKKTLDIEPNFILAHNDLGNSYYQKGMYAEAVDEFIKYKELSGWKPEMTNALRQAYTVSGIKGYWAKELDLANKELEQHPVGTMRMARIYTELGEKDHAFEWLEKAYDERNSLMIFIKVLPHFDSLHSDSRFLDLQRRIGLTP